MAYMPLVWTLQALMIGCALGAAYGAWLIAADMLWPTDDPQDEGP